MALICGTERVERFEDFSEKTQQHIIDNIAKVLSEILSDKYDCKVTIRFKPKTQTEPTK